MIMFKFFQLFEKRCDFQTIVNHLTTGEYFIASNLVQKDSLLGKIRNEVATCLYIICQRNSSYHKLSRKARSLEKKTGMILYFIK